MFQQLLANKHHRLRDSVPITIWPSGGLRLVTDKKKKKKKSRVKQEPRSAHGRAVNKWWPQNITSYFMILTNKWNCQQKFTYTVEPLLSGHPPGNGNWLHNRGWPLNTGSSEISKRQFKKVTSFHYKKKWNGITEPHEDNNKPVFE